MVDKDPMTLKEAASAAINTPIDPDWVWGFFVDILMLVGGMWVALVLVCSLLLGLTGETTMIASRDSGSDPEAGDT